MNSEQPNLQPSLKTGSSAYYACLFLSERQRLQLTPLLNFIWRIERISRFTQEPEVAVQQLAWWKNEVIQSFTGNGTHPTTQAIAATPIKESSISSYLTHLYQLQKDCQIDNHKAFLEYALQHRRYLLQAATDALQLHSFSDSELSIICPLLSWLDVIDGFHRDAHRGLIYLPLEHLIQFNLTIDEIASSNDAFSTKSQLFWNDCYRQMAKLYQQLWITSKQSSPRKHPLLLATVIYAALRLNAFTKSLQNTNSITNNCYNQRPTQNPLRKLWLTWTIRSRWLSGKTAPRIYNHD